MILDLDSRMSGGLGDLIALSWLMQASKQTGDPISGMTKDPQKRLALQVLGQEHSEDWECAIDLSQSFEREIDEGCKLPRYQYWRAHLNRHDIMPVCPDYTVNHQDLAWVRHNLTGLDSKKLVLLFPSASQTCRTWPVSYWFDLSEMLNAAGYIVLVIHAGPELDGLFHLSVKDASFDRIAAMMKLCSLVVANDSFPAHLGATIGRPTLVLLGPSRAECVFGHCLDRIKVLQTAKSVVPCSECCGAKSKIRRSCTIMCESLSMLQPRTVFAKALEMIK